MGVLTVPQVMVVAFVVPSLVDVVRRRELRGACPCWSDATGSRSPTPRSSAGRPPVEIVVPGDGRARRWPWSARHLARGRRAELRRVGLVRSAAVVRAMYDRTRVPVPLTRQALLGDIAEGLRFLVRHPGVRTMTIVGTVQCISGGGFIALTGRLVRPGARRRDRRPPVRPDLLRLECGARCWRTVLLTRLLRSYSPADIALGALPFSAVLGVLTALAPDWQLAALGMLDVGDRVHDGRRQLDLLPPAGDAGAASRPGQPRRTDAVLGARVDRWRCARRPAGTAGRHPAPTLVMAAALGLLSVASPGRHRCVREPHSRQTHRLGVVTEGRFASSFGQYCGP